MPRRWEAANTELLSLLAAGSSRCSQDALEEVLDDGDWRVIECDETLQKGKQMSS